MTCDKPPSGWKCTRELGHDGPCAAYPDTVRPEPLPGPVSLESVDESPVICTGCGSNHTHQHTVFVRARETEGGPGRQYTIGPGLMVAELPADSYVWHGRREELVVLLTCEQCEGLTELILRQHKGETLLSVGRLKAVRS
jgi:hypothetical protein